MITTFLLLASVLVEAELALYLLGVISKTLNLGLGRRQDAGYSPTQTHCGPGNDCASSCGATYIPCTSTDKTLHCYDPTVKESCCPDGSGKSCQVAYFCTSDTSGGSWCCPDGMDLARCAAAYSLTDVLVSQVATAASIKSPSSTSTAAIETPNHTHSLSTSTDKPPYTLSGSHTTTSSPSLYTGSSLYQNYNASTVSNVTVWQTITATGVQFTGSAGHVVVSGLKAFALAADVFLVL